jgi:Fe-S oxidoreductase
MTHLTPSIINAMTNILEFYKVNYLFLDKDGGVCCGRTMKTSGNFEAAEELMNYNRRLILMSEAKTLVTSCPICLKIFKDDYKLPIEVIHHSEYILRLVEENNTSLKKENIKAVYHDPCELGRGIGVYEAPRELLEKALNLVDSGYDKENSLCCGGSLANIILNSQERNIINKDVLNKLLVNSPEMLITSCPLCKKTFHKNTQLPIKDIAEVIDLAINHK